MWQLHEAPDDRSTQTIALDWLQAGQPGDSAFGIWSLNQAEGRGQYGRQWLHAGEALALTLVWPGSPHAAGAAPRADQPYPWPIWVSLSVREALLEAYPSLAEGLRIKWPNDLLWQGRKLGGVLVQSLRRHQTDWLVAGIGLNGRWTRPQPEGLAAADLAEALGACPGPHALNPYASGDQDVRRAALQGLAQRIAAAVARRCDRLARGEETPAQLAAQFEAFTGQRGQASGSIGP